MPHEKLIHFLRKETIEHLIIVKNNRVVMDVLGDETKVSLDNKHIHLLKDATLYHNHIKSSTFSISDVKNLLLYESKEIHLVTKNYVHSIKRPNNLNWKTEIVILEKAIKKT